jgi:hypothetical protein
MLNRNEYQTQYEYLFHLMNDLGDEDLSIAYFSDGVWSKWYKFMDLMHLDQDKIIWRGKTVSEFIELANNRTVLDIEIIFDFDEDQAHSQKREDIFNFAQYMIEKLNAAQIFGEAYFSGSKSIHYSCLFPELRDMNNYNRALFKEKILSFTGADASKKAKRTMIALEGAPHWKTGNKKERCTI